MRKFCMAAGLWALTAVAATAAPDPGKWRMLDPAQTLYIDTNRGRVIVEMYPEIAPLAVARVKQLARDKFYDGLTFHRVIANFMAQGGDPLGNGQGGSKLPDLQDEFRFRRGMDLEFTPASRQGGAVQGFYRALPLATQPDDMMLITKDKKASAWGLHCKGVAAMAHADDPNTANSQFYLTRADYPSLDKLYTIWGRVVYGQNVVDNLAIGDPPPIPDKMTSVRVASDLPAGERAPLYVLRTDGEAFLEEIKKTTKKRGANFSVCDIPIPAMVPKDSDNKGKSWWSKLPLIP